MTLIKKITAVLLTGIIISSEIFAESKPDNPPVDSAKLLLDLSNSQIDAGDFIKSLETTKALHYYRLRHYRNDDPIILASFANLIDGYMLISDYDSVEYFRKQAEQFRLKYGITKGLELSSLYSNIGLVMRNKGDYLEARNYYMQAEKCLLKSDVRIDPEDLAIIYIRLANIERLLHNYDEALKYFNLSLAYLDNKQKTQFTITSLTGIALVYSEMKKYPESLAYKKKALKLARQDSINSGLQLAVLYSNIGQDYTHVNELENAEKNLLRSLDQFNYMGYKGTYSASVYENLGLLSEKKGEYQTALSYYQKAIENLTPEFRAVDKISCPSFSDLFPSPALLRILKSKAKCLGTIYHKSSEPVYLDAAINTYMTGIMLVDEMRNSYQSYESKLQIAKDEYDIYRSALSLANIGYRKTHDSRYLQYAFEVSEKSKSALLLASLRELDAREMGGIPEELLKEEKNISRLINQYKNNIYEAKQAAKPDDKKIKQWESALFETQQKHNKLIETFEKDYPAYYSLKIENDVPHVKDIQQTIPGNTSLIEYSIGDTVLYIFVLTKSSYHLITERIDSTFFTLISDYVNQFHRFDFSKQSFDDYSRFCSVSYSLYNLLINPVSAYLHSENLLIVPDGILSYIPFETLIREIPSKNASYYKSLDYLLYNYTISYFYSSSLFLEVKHTGRKRKTDKLLAFAPEYKSDFDAGEYLTHHITRQNFREDLYPIPGVVEEVKTISALIPGEVFMGTEATESNFRAVASGYDILHLAMHAVIDNENPLFSKLVFTLTNDSLEDGLLNTHEIFNLQLNARMVVLSACNTGQGDYSQGEGVMSLARGFVYAGSPSLIMTMWEVEDKSGSILMKSFYENLLKGQTKAAALRNAKIRYLREARPENLHPFFWSSFVAMGNTKPLFINKNLYYYLAGGIMLGLISILVMRRRKHQISKVRIS